MAFGAFNPHRQQSMMSDINVTPMVDVMLVLLIIFILTAPMLTHAVKLDLPQASAAAQPGASVTIAIDAAGVVYWDDAVVDAGQLDARLVQAAALTPQPELQLRADKDTRYEKVAQVLAAAQQLGLTQLGFVTDPNKEKPHGQH